MTQPHAGILSKIRYTEAGNIFFALFGAVGLVGVLGAAATTILKGPVAGMQRVTKYTVAENNMIAAGKLALIAATNQPLSGDCDADDMVEPIPFSTTGDGPLPTGGGYLPAEIGATRQDPWGNIYGYCVWDHGIDPEDPTDNDGECGGNTNFRAGADSEQYIALAVISSGPDRIFQSSCNDFDPENPDLPLVVKSAGSDDVVLAYTYAEAGSMSGGLWKLKSGDSSTAEVGNRNVEISGSGGSGDSARIGYDEGLDMSGVGDFLAVKTDFIYARTADGDVSMESPLRVKVVEELEKPMGVAGEGVGTKSVIAPKLRQQVPTMPIAPDGQDWADAIICPGTTPASMGGVFTLHWYNGLGSGNDQVAYRYEYQGTTDHLVFYHHTTGARGSTNGGGTLHGNMCPATYAAAIKVYYGGGGGGNVPSILPGWPDAIKCPRTDAENNIFYLMNTGQGNRVLYTASFEQSGSPINWMLDFNKSTRQFTTATGSGVTSFLSNAARHCRNASTTIDMLVEDGRGIFFGGGGDGGASAPAIPSFSCPGGFEKVGALGCIQSVENAANSWTAATNACLSNHGGRLPTSAEWYAAAANSSTMTGKTGNWEWIGDLVGESSPYDNHGVVGSTAITDFSWSTDATAYTYRCFIPASGGGGLGGGGGGGDFQIASGKFVFPSSSPPLCGSSTSNLCTVDISSGGFSAAPSCNITLYNSDGTSYTENVVIHSTSPTQLKFWRGQYLNNGTSFIGDWICAVGSGSGGGQGSGGGKAIFTRCSNENSNGNGTNDKPECVAAAGNSTGAGNYRALSCSISTSSGQSMAGWLNWTGTKWRNAYSGSWYDCDDNSVIVVDTAATTGGSGGGSSLTWVNFNGTSCPSNNCSIMASNNVSSVTRLSAGIYQVAFTTPMSDVNYGVTGSASQGGNGFSNGIGLATNSYPSDYKQTNYAKVSVTTPSTTYADNRDITVMFIPSEGVGGGSGGGSGASTMVSGWPDALQCTNFAGEGANSSRTYVFKGRTTTQAYYAMPGETGYYIIYNIDGTLHSAVGASGLPTLGDCNGKTISQLYTEGKAFKFVGGGGSGSGGGGSIVGETITANIPANQDISGACIYPGTGTLTIPETGHYFVRAHASGYKYSGNAVDITLFLEKSGGGHVFSASGGIPSTSNAYFYADVSDVVILEAGTYTLKAQTTNGSACSTTTLSKLFAGYVWAKKLSGGGSGSGGGESVWSTSGSNVYRSSGNVGVGTTTPLTPLHAVSPVPVLILQDSDNTRLENGVTGFISFRDSGGTEYGWVGDGSTGSNVIRLSSQTMPVALNTDGHDRLYVANTGNVGVGTSSPNYLFTVEGTMRANQIRFTDESTSGSALCYSTGSGTNIVVRCASLRKYKEDIDDLSLGMDEIMRLRPVQYKWIEKNGGKKDFGFIAEEVEAVNPLMAEYADGKLISVKYNHMVALLTKGIQELKRSVDDLVAKVAELFDIVGALRTENAALKERVDTLEQRLEALEEKGQE